MFIDAAIIIVLLMLSALFSGSETAFTSLSLMQVEDLAVRKGKAGKLLKSMYSRSDIFIATVLICNNLVNVSLSAFVTTFTIKAGGSNILGLVTGLLTLFLLIFGEITPKNIAMNWNEQIALYTIPIIYVLSIILRPVIAIINFCSSLITCLLGPKQQKKITAEMLYNMIKSADNAGIMKDYERRMLNGLFIMRQSTLRNVMTHRTDVFSMDENLELSDAIDAILRESHSKIPIYHENPENITGVVRYNQLLMEVKKNNLHIKLKELASKPVFIQETKKLDHVFKQMKKTGDHFAVVVDEYGGLAGIVTLTDIIEEILGAMQEKEEAIPETEKIDKVSDTEYIIAGEAPVFNVCERLKIQLPWDNSVRTIGGLIIKELQRIPAAGETVQLGEYTFTIEEVSERQILRIKFIRK
ncbi:MAG: hemolysin family protein [Spirochaetia bacterium]|nr:hemolysin family protein [Spirochaetia bacterium]